MNQDVPVKHQLIFSLLLYSLLGFALYLYSAGLPGRFILDDETNLYRLNSLNNDSSLKSLFAYVADGLSSALGRPVSLLSFAGQYYSWPHDPGAFKYVNIMIHLLNGIFILILCRQLLALMDVNRVRSLYLSLLVTALWILHPIQISTVLYVVQRMTQLSGLFMLLGMITYLRGRRQIIETPERKLVPFMWMSVGIGAGGIFAILSKENGILLPLYVLAIEFTLLQKCSQSNLYKHWRRVFLYLPVALLGIYIVYSFNGFITDYHHREFSMLERVLTETRVLSHYLYKLFIIQPASYGVFQDDFTVSKSLFSPLNTLAAVLFIIGLFVAAFRFRKQKPVLAFAIFWFFVSHFLESGFIPLEIYFEHRNYIAVFGVMFGFVLFLHWALNRINSTLIKRTALLAALGWCSIVVVVSAQEINLWGKPLLQAQIWGKERPWSKRAQVTRVNAFALYGKYKAASTTLHQLATKYPKDAAIYFALFQLQCFDARVTMYDFTSILKKLETAKSSYSALTTLAKIVLLKEQGKCIGLNNVQVEQLLNVLIKNKRFDFQLADLYFLKARYYLLLKKLDKALHFFALSWNKQPRMAIKMYQIHVHAYLKQFKKSYEHVQAAEKFLESNLKARFLYGAELTKWKKVILERLIQAKGATR